MNFNIFWRFLKNEYFLGYDEIADIFLGNHKTGLFLGVISIILGLFLKDTVQNLNIFRGLLNFKYFLGYA